MNISPEMIQAAMAMMQSQGGGQGSGTGDAGAGSTGGADGMLQGLGGIMGGGGSSPDAMGLQDNPFLAPDIGGTDFSQLQNALQPATGNDDIDPAKITDEQYGRIQADRKNRYGQQFMTDFMSVMEPPPSIEGNAPLQRQYWGQ